MVLRENVLMLAMAWACSSVGAGSTAAGLGSPLFLFHCIHTAWDPPETPLPLMGNTGPSPPPITELLPLPIPSNSSAESLDRLYPAVGSTKPPRKRTTSQCKSEPPLLRTSKRTIYTAGRPPWYNEHGTQSKEAFVIGRQRQRMAGLSRLCLQLVKASTGSVGAVCPVALQEILGTFLPHRLLGNLRLTPDSRF